MDDVLQWGGVELEKSINGCGIMAIVLNSSENQEIQSDLLGVVT